jgi:PAS domain S-box-containing protein
VRILYLEKDPLDVELFRHHLEKEQYPAVLRVVETRQQFQHELATFAPDCIVLDYHLPLFSAPEALQVLREHQPVAGVIVFTGSVSEEQAIECLRLGADDYVTKQNPQRLVSAIQSVIEKKKMEKAFRRKSRELERYFENSLDLLCIADSSGYFLRLNPEWEKTLGFSIAELTGKQFMEFVHPDDVTATREELKALSSQQVVLNFINRYRCRDGSYRWLEWRSFPEGEIIYAVARDITDRKQSEKLMEGQTRALELIATGRPLQECLDRLLRTVEDLSAGMLTSILLLAEDGVHVHHIAAPSLPEEYLKAIDGSPIGERAGSCGTAAYKGVPVIVEDIQTDPLWTDYRELAAKFDLRACWSTPIFDQRRRVLGTFALYFLEPRLPSPFHLWLIDAVTHVAAIAISAIRRENKLRESEEKFYTIFQNAPFAAGLSSIPDFKLLEVNHAFERLWGYNAAEVTGKTTLELGMFPDEKERRRLSELFRDQGFIHNAETIMQFRSGSVFDILINSDVVMIGNKPFALTTVQDITHRNYIERQIRESMEEFAILNRVIRNMTGKPDLNIRLEIILDEALSITGLEGGTICLLNPDDTFDLTTHRSTSQETIDDLSTHQVKIGDCLCGNAAKDCKPLILHTPEEVLDFATREVLRGEDIRFHAAFPFVVAEKCLGVLCVFTRTDAKPGERSLKLLETIVAQSSIDILNAKLWEEIRSRESTLTSIYNTVGDVIFQLAVEQDEVYRFVSINPAFCRVTGLTAEQIVGKAVHEVIPEPSLTMVLGKYREAIEARSHVTWEEVSEYPSGRLTGVVTIAPVFNEKEECTHLVGSVHDITERKRSEEQIMAQLNELRLWQKVMIGREERILEMKKEVNHLLRRLGEPETY